MTLTTNQYLIYRVRRYDDYKKLLKELKWDSPPLDIFYIKNAEEMKHHAPTSNSIYIIDQRVTTKQIEDRGFNLEFLVRRKRAAA